MPDSKYIDARIFNLGAGVQSTALFYLSLFGILPKIDVVIFSDTGWEPAAVYQQLWDIAVICEKNSIPLIIVSQGDILSDMLEASDKSRSDNPPYWTQPRNGEGKGGKLLRKCTQHYKARPIERMLTKLKRKHGWTRIEQWFGISMDEKRRARESKRKWIKYEFPLLYPLRMSRQDCLTWLDDHNIKRPQKSACIGCPFRSDEEWMHLYYGSCSEWDSAVAVDEAIREGVGGTTDLLFSHRSRQPLTDLPFLNRDPDDDCGPTQLCMFCL